MSIEKNEEERYYITTKCKTLLFSSIDSHTMKPLYRTVHLARLTDRQIPRHESCRQCGPLSSPLKKKKKITYQPVNTGQPEWSTCLNRATPSSLQVSRTHMHPHKHPNLQTHWEYSLQSPIGVEDEHDCHYHTSGACFIGVITSPRAMIPPPSM